MCILLHSLTARPTIRASLVPRHSYARSDQAADYRPGRLVRSSSGAQAGSRSGGWRKARGAEGGAAVIPPWRPMTRSMTSAATQAVYEAWQAREKCIACVAFVQIPSDRIARNTLDSLPQVRRLLGKRIVAEGTRGAGEARCSDGGVRGRSAISARPSSDTCNWLQPADAPDAR